MDMYEFERIVVNQIIDLADYRYVSAVRSGQCNTESEDFQVKSNILKWCNGKFCSTDHDDKGSFSFIVSPTTRTLDTGVFYFVETEPSMTKMSQYVRIKTGRDAEICH